MVNMLRPERLRADFMDEILCLFDSTINRWADMQEIFLQNETSQMVLNLIAKQLLGLSPSKETAEIQKLFVEFIRAIVAIPLKIPGTTHAKGLKIMIFLKGHWFLFQPWPHIEMKTSTSKLMNLIHGDGNLIRTFQMNHYLCLLELGLDFVQGIILPDLSYLFFFICLSQDSDGMCLEMTMFRIFPFLNCLRDSVFLSI